MLTNLLSLRAWSSSFFASCFYLFYEQVKKWKYFYYSIYTFYVGSVIDRKGKTRLSFKFFHFRL